MREGEDRTGFQGEKQNQPPEPDQCLFAEARPHFRDPRYDNERVLIAGEPLALEPSDGLTFEQI